MGSLLARFFSGHLKSDTTPDKSSNRITGHAASNTRSATGDSANLKPRKSITTLFGFTIDLIRDESRPDTPTKTIATCREAQHYPIYDATNPDHEPSALSSEDAHDHSSYKQIHLRSPTKLLHRKGPPSPRKSTPSTRAKSRLQGFADSLRAKANIFYDKRTESSEGELLLHEAVAPHTPISVKSISSKKSVRFRSGHSVIGNVLPQSSPIASPTRSPPSLPMVDISNTPMFEEISKEEENYGQKARLPETLLPNMPSGLSPRKSSPPQLFTNLEDATYGARTLPTPMPGTNLPLEDPFQDPVPALRHGPSPGNVHVSEGGPSTHYLPEESNAASDNTNIAGTDRMENCSAHSKPPSYSDTKKSSPSEVSQSVPDSHDGSSNSSPHRTLRRMKPLYDGSPGISSFCKLTPEIESGADAEASEDIETQKKKISDVALEGGYHSENCDIEIDRDSQSGSDLVRCETPEMQQVAVLAEIPILRVRGPSSDESVESSSSYPSASGRATRQENRPIIGQTSCASDLSEKENFPKHMFGIDEDVEDVEPHSLIEPSKQHEPTVSGADNHSQSASPTRILAPHLSPTSSTSSPHSLQAPLYRSKEENTHARSSEENDLNTITGPASPLLLGDGSRDWLQPQDEAGPPERASSASHSTCFDHRPSSPGHFLSHIQSSRLEDTPLQAESRPNLQHGSVSEIGSIDCEPTFSQVMNEKHIVSPESDDWRPTTKSHKRSGFAQGADFNGLSQAPDTTDLANHTRKQSSEESRESMASLSTMLLGSAGSGSIASASHSADSKVLETSTSISHQ